MIFKAHARKGFTLIELLVVVVIIGILAGVGVKGFQSAQDRARNSSMMSNVRTVFLGVENWKTDYAGVPLELIDKTGAADGQATAVAGGNGTNMGSWPKYMPGGLLPRTPWANVQQRTMEARTLKDATTIPTTFHNTIKQSATGSQDDFRLGDKGFKSDGLEGTGAGTIPDKASGPARRTDYGYMYYMGDSTSGRYAIFGIGKIEGKAYIVAIKTNFN